MVTPAPIIKQPPLGGSRQDGERLRLLFQECSWKSHTSLLLVIPMARISPSHTATPSCQGSLANGLYYQPKLEMEKGY